MNHDDALLAEQAQAVRQMFERIPFNQALGIELDEISTSRVVMHLPMKPELVGNFVHGILHGGVIASLLDVAGGAMAMLGAFDKHRHLTMQERAARLSRLGTIDLRIDYLRPAAVRASLPARPCCARATRSRWCVRSCTTNRTR